MLISRRKPIQGAAPILPREICNRPESIARRMATGYPRWHRRCVRLRFGSHVSSLRRSARLMLLRVVAVDGCARLLILSRIQATHDLRQDPVERHLHGLHREPCLDVLQLHAKHVLRPLVLPEANHERVVVASPGTWSLLDGLAVVVLTRRVRGWNIRDHRLAFRVGPFVTAVVGQSGSVPGHVPHRSCRGLAPGSQPVARTLCPMLTH